MKINLQTVDVNISPSTRVFLEKKIEKMQLFFEKIIAVDVYIKEENTSDKENKQVEIRVEIPGENILVKKQCKTFEEAIDQSTSAAERILVKRKEKTRAH